MRALLILVLLQACRGTLCLREDLTYESTTCLGGINEQSEKASSDQCADARNLWARNGRVEQRPGYTGVMFFHETTGSALSGVDVDGEDVGTGFTGGTLSNLAVGDRWYFGASATFNGVRVDVAANTNSNATQFIAEYWNGTAWTWLIVTEIAAGATPAKSQPHLSDGGGLIGFVFAAPGDWATTEVNGDDLYWVRLTLQEAALDASVVVILFPPPVLLNPGDIRGLFGPRFPSTKRYITTTVNPTQSSIYYDNAATLDLYDNYRLTRTGALSGEPATMAVVPEFDEAYVAYRNLVTVHHAYPATFVDRTAAVENRDVFVGANARYSPNYIAQLGGFPLANYVAFFRGFLWAAGIDGEPHTVRWSAPSPAYRVWPSISYEVIAENDNSSITAIYGFGESMLVWKNDSMWQMVFTGFNEFGLAEFAPVRIPSGVGCVSQSSIVEIQGLVYWLAEDGVYSFNGARVAPVFKDRIQSYFRRINPSRRAFAVAANWAQYNVYLLAAAIDGSNANNIVFAYDYENKAWWLWDEIEAQFWLPDEDAADNAVLYFGDASGRVYEMGKGLTDHGSAITSYATTHRFGRRWRGHTKTARLVTVDANNLARSLTVECIPDDAQSGRSQARSYTDKSEIEYGAAVAASEYVPDRRRQRRVEFRDDCRHFQAKVTHNTKNTPFAMQSIDAGYGLRARRR